MTLADVMADYEDEAVCDLAEVYGIFDIYKHPPFFIATLLIGLRNDSRLKMKIANLSYTTNQILLAGITDRLDWLCWAQSKDGRMNRNRPESLAEKMIRGETDKNCKEVQGFKNPEEFRSAWERINKERGD